MWRTSKNATCAIERATRTTLALTAALRPPVKRHAPPSSRTTRRHAFHPGGRTLTRFALWASRRWRSLTTATNESLGCRDECELKARRRCVRQRAASPRSTQVGTTAWNRRGVSRHASGTWRSVLSEADRSLRSAAWILFARGRGTAKPRFTGLRDSGRRQGAPETNPRDRCRSGLRAGQTPRGERGPRLR
eukprot:Amastigsp_a177374_26.p2 type:complete len:191 gc:universal Amastigsp_a177374_26:1948-1376(-)